MTAMELNQSLSGGDFPYETVEDFVDDVMDELENSGEI
jgi:hypothetical protein